MQKTIDGTIIYADALNGTTTFSDVSYTTSVSMIATEVYLFVKIPGYADEGAQIYAYSGNQIECTVSIFGTALWAENGNLTSINLTGSDNFVIRSAYYGNHYERAVKTFVEYKQGLTTKETYILHRVDLEFYGDLISEYESIHNGNFVQSSDKVVLTVDVPTDLGGLYYT